MPSASKAHESKMDFTDGSYQINSGDFRGECPPPPAPRLGNHIINTGNGRSVGTTISLRCPTKHRLVGGELKCVMDANIPRWVGELSCKPLSLFKDSGFRVAVLASIVSVGIILIMSMMFITCCILDCVQKNTKKKQSRDSFKIHFEDGISCYSLEDGCDAVIPENLGDSSPPQWITYGLGQTNTPVRPHPSGFYDNQHPAPQKSDRVQVFGPPHSVAVSSRCKCSSSRLVRIPVEETDLVWQPNTQQLRSTQTNA
ncbi:uncharacterized protein LOC133512610 [Syngnathoides biaculeatus]|uniref:uncharacterized protein LOC133512610 n=1 Tax=Syngnathoides biaculeatus TaxID=300417 RepID=UPI002ADE385C|nr:uncharacterized protein LOC133512610 [Syngnathoides biaculeatus]